MGAVAGSCERWLGLVKMEVLKICFAYTFDLDILMVVVRSFMTAAYFTFLKVFVPAWRLVLCKTTWTYDKKHNNKS